MYVCLSVCTYVCTVYIRIIYLKEPDLNNETVTTSIAENSLELCKYLKKRNFHYQHINNIDPCTVERCFKCYTMLDVLDENNKFICDTCNQKIGEYKNILNAVTTM